jgi:hypothetical protein
MKIMRKLFFALALIVSTTSLYSNSAVANDWHTWTQAVRNQAIVNRTYQDNNKYVGLNCKQWVRKVVYDASKGAVSIPSTASNLYTWVSNNNVAGRSGLIQYARPGEIVQMLLSSGIEHTAIVLAVAPTGVTFIESNWDNDEVVHTRFVTFSKFKQQVRSFSIYTIL